MLLLEIVTLGVGAPLPCFHRTGPNKNTPQEWLAINEEVEIVKWSYEYIL